MIFTFSFKYYFNFLKLFLYIMKTNNNQKQVSTYVKLFQEKLKQEEDLKNNSKKRNKL